MNNKQRYHEIKLRLINVISPRYSRKLNSIGSSIGEELYSFGNESLTSLYLSVFDNEYTKYREVRDESPEKLLEELKAFEGVLVRISKRIDMYGPDSNYMMLYKIIPSISLDEVEELLKSSNRDLIDTLVKLYRTHNCADMIPLVCMMRNLEKEQGLLCDDDFLYVEETDTLISRLPYSSILTIRIVMLVFLTELERVFGDRYLDGASRNKVLEEFDGKVSNNIIKYIYRIDTLGKLLMVSNPIKLLNIVMPDYSNNSYKNCWPYTDDIKDMMQKGLNDYNFNTTALAKMRLLGDLGDDVMYRGLEIDEAIAVAILKELVNNK